jgi:hypothetical protein
MKFKLGVGILRALQEDTSFGREAQSSAADVRAWQAIEADWRAGANVVTVYLDEEARQALVAKIKRCVASWSDRHGLDGDDLVSLYRRREQQARAALAVLETT